MQLKMNLLIAAWLLTRALAVPAPAPAPATEATIADTDIEIALRNVTAAQGGAYFVSYAGDGCTGDNFSFGVPGGSGVCRSAPNGRSIFWSGR